MTNDKHLNQTRMVFIGRGVAWKNMEFIISSLRSMTQKNVCALLVLPSIESETREALNTEFGERIEFEIGKKIEDIVFKQNDVNVYPVNYGPNANFIESISLNCLELACLGVPSLVSKDGCGTWPELKRQGIIREVDWKQIQSFEAALDIANQSKFESSDLDRFRSIISIENNLKEILQF